MSENAHSADSYSGKYPAHLRYDYYPYQGIHIPGTGMLVFGMSKERVEKVLEEFPKGKYGKYSTLGLSLRFDSENGLMSIAVNKTATIMLFNQSLLEDPFVEIVKGIKESETEYYLEGNEDLPFGITSIDLGFATTQTSQVDDDEDEMMLPPEVICLFAEWLKDEYRPKKSK